MVNKQELTQVNYGTRETSDRRSEKEHSISKLDGLVYYNGAGSFRVWFNDTGLAPSMSENLI